MSACSAREPFTYCVHGLTLRTPLDIACFRRSPGAGGPELSHSEAELPSAPKGAQVIASLSLGDVGYRALQSDSEVWFEFTNQAKFLLSMKNGQIRHQLLPGGDPHLPTQFLPNAVLAVWLGLAGHAVLHASAVSLDGCSLAVVGPSGAGKSSIAAALCHVGASLLTDDALRIDVKDGEAGAYPGTARLRLRAGAEQLASGLSSAGTERTSDGRLGVTLPPTEAAPSLGFVWQPVVVPSDQVLEATALSGHARLVSVLSNVRVAGWAPPQMAKLLPALRAIAAAVPFYRVKIPQGLIFSDSGRAELRELAQSCLQESRKC